ncbi:MAG: CZB domain-containing protein [Polyangiaceae bacterium]
MELDSALQAHADWKTKLRMAINKQEKVDAVSLGRDDCCALGKWLHGPGRGTHGAKSSFQKLVSAHASFHREAGRVAEAINRGEFARATEMLAATSAYGAASSGVGVAVVAMKKDL